MELNNLKVDKDRSVLQLLICIHKVNKAWTFPNGSVTVQMNGVFYFSVLDEPR